MVSSSDADYDRTLKGMAIAYGDLLDIKPEISDEWIEEELTHEV